MADFSVEFTGESRKDLWFYPAAVRRRIVDAVREDLTHDPCVEGRNRKKLRSNPLATWELRVGAHRVFFDVDEPGRTVTVTAVGHKEHERLMVRGEEVKI